MGKKKKKPLARATKPDSTYVIEIHLPPMISDDEATKAFHAAAISVEKILGKKSKEAFLMRRKR